MQAQSVWLLQHRTIVISTRSEGHRTRTAGTWWGLMASGTYQIITTSSSRFLGPYSLNGYSISTIASFNSGQPVNEYYDGL